MGGERNLKYPRRQPPWRDAESMSSRWQPRFTLWSAFCSFWRENATAQGKCRTLRMLADELGEFARDCLPSRRRQRYGDIDFDFDYRVDTTAANIGRLNHLVGVLSGTPYQPCDPELFRATVGGLEIAYEQFTFVDIGSGKGRALLLAAEYPFRRIVGVEWMPELHRSALENIRRLQSGTQKCRDIEPICADARQFEFPAGALLVFLFNPLPERALKAVIGNLEEAIRLEPRPVWLVYHNPLLEHVMAERGVFRKTGGTMQWAVFTNHLSAAQPEDASRKI